MARKHKAAGSVPSIFVSNSSPECSDGPSINRPSRTRPKKKDSRRASPITQYSRSTVSSAQMEGIPTSFAADAARRPTAVAIAIRTPAYEPGPRPTTIASGASELAASKAANSRRTGRNAFDRWENSGRTMLHVILQPGHDSPGRWRVRGEDLHCGPPSVITRVFSSLSSNEIHFACVRNEIRVTVGPFDQRNAVAEDVIVESEAQNGVAVLEPIKIEMVNRQTAVLVFVNEDEGRAGHFRAAPHTCHEAFHELRLPRAEIAGQREHISFARIPPIRPGPPRWSLRRYLK